MTFPVFVSPSNATFDIVLKFTSHTSATIVYTNCPDTQRRPGFYAHVGYTSSKWIPVDNKRAWVPTKLSVLRMIPIVRKKHPELLI